MLIVAVAWIYVVGLMSLTETSFIAGFMTFLMYCVVPLSILFYLTGGRGRRRRADEAARTKAAKAAKAVTSTTATPGATTATTKDKPASQDDTR